MAIEVIPEQLTAAVHPLHRAAASLRGLGDARRELKGLLDRVPSASLRSAYEAYVEAWTHVALDLGDQADELGDALGYASRWYADRERALARDIRFDRRVP